MPCDSDIRRLNGEEAARLAVRSQACGRRAGFVKVVFPFSPTRACSLWGSKCDNPDLAISVPNRRTNRVF
jgi:hypothetical protein